MLHQQLEGSNHGISGSVHVWEDDLSLPSSDEDESSDEGLFTRLRDKANSCHADLDNISLVLLKARKDAEGSHEPDRRQLEDKIGRMKTSMATTRHDLEQAKKHIQAMQRKARHDALKKVDSIFKNFDKDLEKLSK